MLLHHLPPNAQANESHQAEGFETESGARLHPTGETGEKQNGGNDVPLKLH